MSMSRLPLASASPAPISSGWRSQPVSLTRLPRAVMNTTVAGSSGVSPVADRCVVVRIGPDEGSRFNAAVVGASAWNVVRGASAGSMWTASGDGHSTLVGGGPGSAVVLNGNEKPSPPGRCAYRKSYGDWWMFRYAGKVPGPT